MKVIWSWTAAVLCAILFIISVSEVKGAKGIKGIKIPRPKVPIVPVIVPVVVPIGSRSRINSNDNNRNRLQCYSCEGKNNDPCSLNPAGPGTQRITCPTNQYCIVLRRETIETSIYNVTVNNNSSLIVTLEESTLLTNETISTSTTIMPELSGNSTISETSTLSTTLASEESTLSITSPTPNDTVTSSTTQSTVNRERRAAENQTQKTVLISRGCQSSDFVQGSLLASSGKRENGSHIQVCKTDLCNSGDGRLKCYECEGSGTTDPCATQPASVAKIALCFPDQYCTVVKTTTNSTSASINTTVTTISISRGCKTASSTEDLYNVKLSRRKSTNNMKCSTDLCNSESVYQLFEAETSRRNSAPGAVLSYSVMVGILSTLSSLLLPYLKKP